jgi:SAM-dependent methyltransferase
MDITKFSNYLIFKIGDKFFEKYQPYCKGKLIDLGCGEAPYKNKFRNISKYIGIDWDNSRHNTKADIISNLNEKIELPDNYADTALSLSVMEHLSEPEKFLKETNRVLKKDSYFIIQVPFQWWIHEQPYDFYRYTPYGLKYLLEKSGFEVVEIKPTNGFFTMMALKINYFTIRMFKLPRFLWKIWLILLIPFWVFNQTIAPFLDKIFDRNWKLETQGYWVLARKKNEPKNII